MCEPNSNNIYSTEIIFQIYSVGIITKSGWYNLYINSEDLLSNIIFLSVKQDEWKPAFRLTKRYLVYGWATKSVSVKTNKLKISAA